MKKTIYSIFVILFCFQLNGKTKSLFYKTGLDQYSKTVAGIYKSDFNELTLHVNGNHVTGTYKYKEGKVDGILSGNKLVGTWWQTNGNGKLEFSFNSDFSAFTGKWGYNDSPPAKKWNGTKISEIRTEVPLTSVGNNSGANNSTPPYEGILGVFNTDFNKMIIYVNGKDITGEYKHKEGRIAGKFNGHTLTGTWTQSNGKGKMEFVFNTDYSAFRGKWGYNDETPTRKWDGTKVAENYDGLLPLFGAKKGGNTGSNSGGNIPVVQNNSKIEGTYQSDFNELTLHINGNHVTGTYKYRDGRVEGTLNGHTLTGTWSQSNGKGRMQFIFSDDFSSFQGKYGYNESTPTSKWNGTKL